MIQQNIFDKGFVSRVLMLPIYIKRLVLFNENFQSIHGKISCFAHLLSEYFFADISARMMQISEKILLIGFIALKRREEQHRHPKSVHSLCHLDPCPWS